MKFSALNIKNQQFNKSIRGYDKDEVHVFLEKLSDEFEKLNNENESLRKELDKATLRINDYRKIEKNLQDTLLKAHESSSKAVESAKKQANLVLKEAEIKASQTIEKAKKSADEVRNSVLNLREEKNLLVAKLKAFVQTQSELIEMKTDEKPELKLAEIKKEDKKEPQINIDEIVEKLL